MRKPKEESRILYVVECKCSIALIVYRSYSLEDFSYICGSNIDYFILRRVVSHLKTFEEIMYFATNSNRLQSLLGSMGIYSLPNDLLQELMVRHRDSLNRICMFTDSICLHTSYGMTPECLEIIK